MKSVVLVTGAASGIGKLTAGAFTRGTVHFPTAGKPSDEARCRLRALRRDHGSVRRAIERLDALTTQIPGDGAKEVIELAEEVRIDFAGRLGIADLLQAKIMLKP